LHLLKIDEVDPLLTGHIIIGMTRDGLVGETDPLNFATLAGIKWVGLVV